MALAPMAECSCKRAVIAVVAALTFLVGGCTTVNRGVIDHLFVDTVPQGARVLVDRGPDREPIICAKTPCAIALVRSSDVIVGIEHPGYEPVELYVTNTGKRVALAGSFATSATTSGALVTGSAAYGGALLGNILSLGGGSSGVAGSAAAAAAGPAAGVAAGMVVTDLASGATRNLAPNPIIVALPPEGAGVVEDARVALFREKRQRKAAQEKACGTRTGARRDKACKEAEEALSAVTKALRAENKRLFSAP